MWKQKIFTLGELISFHHLKPIDFILFSKHAKIWHLQSRKVENKFDKIIMIMIGIGSETWLSWSNSWLNCTICWKGVNKDKLHSGRLFNGMFLYSEYLNSPQMLLGREHLLRCHGWKVHSFIYITGLQPSHSCITGPQSNICFPSHFSAKAFGLEPVILLYDLDIGTHLLKRYQILLQLTIYKFAFLCTVYHEKLLTNMVISLYFETK